MFLLFFFVSLIAAPLLACTCSGGYDFESCSFDYSGPLCTKRAVTDVVDTRISEKYFARIIISKKTDKGEPVVYKYIGPLDPDGSQFHFHAQVMGTNGKPDREPFILSGLIFGDIRHFQHGSPVKALHIKTEYGASRNGTRLKKDDFVRVLEERPVGEELKREERHGIIKRMFSNGVVYVQASEGHFITCFAFQLRPLASPVTERAAEPLESIAEQDDDEEQSPPTTPVPLVADSTSTLTPAPPASSSEPSGVKHMPSGETRTKETTQAWAARK